MKYIALLRGINISGKNKISMSELTLTKNWVRLNYIYYIKNCFYYFIWRLKNFKK